MAGNRLLHHYYQFHVHTHAQITLRLNKLMPFSESQTRETHTATGARFVKSRSTRPSAMLGGLLVISQLLTVGASTLTVVIDGYTVDSTITSPATLPLGRTALLVCRVSGIPHGQHTTYQWTCPNQPCLQAGYAGRKINNNIIAINTTSTSDGGIYTCTVTAGGVEDRQDFTITIEGGTTVHSYGRLLVNKTLIADIRQLQPPNNDGGDGKIECTATVRPESVTVPVFLSNKTIRIISSEEQTWLVIDTRDRSAIPNFKLTWSTKQLYIYPHKGSLASVYLSSAGIGQTYITVSAQSELTPQQSQEQMFIIGYYRMDLGLPLVGQYESEVSTFMFLGPISSSFHCSSLVPGTRYRFVAWRIDTSSHQRTSTPATLDLYTTDAVPSPPRALAITRIFEDGIELNWLPPQNPNSRDYRYVLTYSADGGSGDEVETNVKSAVQYFNLTGLQRWRLYRNITLFSVNSNEERSRGVSLPLYLHLHPASVGDNDKDTTDYLTAIVVPKYLPCIALATINLALLLVITAAGGGIMAACVGYRISRRCQHRKNSNNIYESISLKQYFGPPARPQANRYRLHEQNSPVSHEQDGMANNKPGYEPFTDPHLSSPLLTEMVEETEYESIHPALKSEGSAEYL